MQNDKKLSDVRLTAAAALLMLAVTFLMPLFLFGGTGMAKQTQDLLPSRPSPAVAHSPEPSPEPDTGTGELDGGRTVRVLHADSGAVEEMSMADYLWGVVAAEMPASFELEALKAQTVTARTYTLWKILHTGPHPDADVCTDFACCQAWLSQGAAALNWGESAAEYAARIAQAVTATDGKILCYDGGPIQAVFHSSSAGRTEDAVSVWGSTVPYLVGVETPEGEEVPNYHTAVSLTAEEVRAVLEPLGCVLGEDPALWFESFTYTNSGAVSAARVGGLSLRGTDLRTALGLRSASFQVDYADSIFTFSVTGYGHGVGMSQYGANALAKEGKTWREIVAWYYTGVTVGEYP